MSRKKKDASSISRRRKNRLKGFVISSEMLNVESEKKRTSELGGRGSIKILQMKGVKKMESPPAGAGGVRNMKLFSLSISA